MRWAFHNIDMLSLLFESDKFVQMVFHEIIKNVVRHGPIAERAGLGIVSAPQIFSFLRDKANTVVEGEFPNYRVRC
jgi:hypothetical protein